MTSLRFIETNILIRQIVRDQAIHAQPTDQLVLEMAAGTVDGLRSMSAEFDSTYVLNKIYEMTWQEVFAGAGAVASTQPVRQAPRPASAVDRSSGAAGS